MALQVVAIMACFPQPPCMGLLPASPSPYTVVVATAILSCGYCRVEPLLAFCLLPLMPHLGRSLRLFTTILARCHASDNCCGGCCCSDHPRRYKSSILRHAIHRHLPATVILTAVAFGHHAAIHWAVAVFTASSLLVTVSGHCRS